VERENRELRRPTKSSRRHQASSRRNPTADLRDDRPSSTATRNGSASSRSAGCLPIAPSTYYEARSRKGIDDVAYATLEWADWSTIAGCSSPWVISRPLSLRWPTIGGGHRHLTHSEILASEPGTAHPTDTRTENGTSSDARHAHGEHQDGQRRSRRFQESSS
jgi:hypothetical protein